MSDNNRNLDNNGEQKKNNYERRNKNYKKYKRFDVNYPVCPLCGNSVKDISSAIAASESDAPAHFDCVIKQIQVQERIEKDERVCYIGKGCFGIIKPQPNGEVKFVIRKRIQYEKEDKSYDWRSNISRRLKK